MIELTKHDASLLHIERELRYTPSKLLHTNRLPTCDYVLLIAQQMFLHEVEVGPDEFFVKILQELVDFCLGRVPLCRDACIAYVDRRR